VFELRNSHPEQLSHIASPEEYLVLKAAGARVERGTTRPGGQQAQQQQPSFEHGLMSEGRLFLQASEAVVLAFRYRLLQLPGSCPQQGAAGAEEPLPQQGSAGEDHSVRLALCTLEGDSPLAVVELGIHPQPAFVGRTFRFDAAEGEPFRAAISIPALAEGGGGLSPAALAGLSAACGAPGAAVAVSREGGRPEVLLRCMAGQAPGSQELCVVLYADALQTRVLEAWRVVVQAVKQVHLTATAGQAAKVRPCCRVPKAAAPALLHTSSCQLPRQSIASSGLSSLPAARTCRRASW
jgi:hypothetical protein